MLSHFPGQGQRSEASLQLLICSGAIRCNTKHLRAWVWPPWLKRSWELQVAAAGWAGRELFAEPQQLPWPVLFKTFWDAESFCPPHTVELTPLSMGSTNLPELSHRERSTNTRETKNHNKRTGFAFLLKKNQGEKEKKIDRKSLFAFFLFKMCTVLENTENQSHSEHKTKGMRE